MRSCYLTLALLGALALASISSAQLASGADLAELSNLTFGWVSMSGVDPTLDMLTSFAPTTLALRDAGYRTGGETVTGEFNFGDLNVQSDFASVMTSVGPGMLRVCHYNYDSNLANIVGLPGMPARTEGEAIEVSYAQRVGEHVTLGLSVVPKDSSSVDMVTEGMTLVESETKTDYGARAGAVINLPHDAKLGFDYSYQNGNSTTKYNPLLLQLPPEAGWQAVSGNFITRCGTLGFSKKFGSATTGYCAYQNILATGDGLGRRNADLVWAGVQQEVAKNLAVRVNYLDGGQNYSIQWRSPIGILNVAYTHHALVNAKEILGYGDAAFAALAVAF